MADNKTLSDATQTVEDAQAKSFAAPQAEHKSRTLWSDAWNRLKRNRLAMVCAVCILFMVLVANQERAVAIRNTF